MGLTAACRTFIFTFHLSHVVWCKCNKRRGRREATANARNNGRAGVEYEDVLFPTAQSPSRGRRASSLCQDQHVSAIVSNTASSSPKNAAKCTPHTGLGLIAFDIPLPHLFSPLRVGSKRSPCRSDLRRTRECLLHSRGTGNAVLHCGPETNAITSIRRNHAENESAERSLVAKNRSVR